MQGGVITPQLHFCHSRVIQAVTNNFLYDGDQMASIDSNTLDYDKNGNMIMGVNNILVYNWDNKLSAALSAVEGSSIALKYDPDGNRVYKESTVSGITTKRKYIVDTVGDLPAILLELDPLTNYSIKKTYIYGNSQILAQHDGSHTAPKYFYLHDRLGSVRQVINSSGDVVCRYTYDPFGQLHLTETEDNSALLNPFKYTGQYFDSETGLYYFRARMYDPYLARFTTYDPIFGKFEQPLSLHKYLYCENEPISRIDPWGLFFHPSGNGPNYNYAQTLEVIQDLHELYNRSIQVLGQDMGFAHASYVAFYTGVNSDDHIGRYDYKADPTKPTFKLWHYSGNIERGDFGNYLAGYAGYYYEDISGVAIMRAAGEYYSLRQYHEFDDLKSKLWITRGVLGANLKESQEGSRGLWGQLDEILIRVALWNYNISYIIENSDASPNLTGFDYGW